MCLEASVAEVLVCKYAMSGFLAVMNVALADIEKLNGAITNYDGIAKKIVATMQDNPAGQLMIVKSQLAEIANFERSSSCRPSCRSWAG